MRENSGKGSFGIYRIWLVLCAAGCVGISFCEGKLPAQYIGKLSGVLACALMALLSLLAFVTGDAEILGLTDPDGKKELPPRRGRRLAAVSGAVFLAGAAAEAACALYRLRGGYTTSLMSDALLAAAIYTAAALAARKITEKNAVGP